MKTISVQPEWCLALPMQQQSVLFLATRGPDGIPKSHPCKDIQRAYRATVLMAAKRGRMLLLGEKADTFMSLDVFGDSVAWRRAVDAFFTDVDQLPHHFTLHLLHGAEIVGYKHPDIGFRSRWFLFYQRGCHDMHMNVETEPEMDSRLGDWGRVYWESDK